MKTVIEKYPKLRPTLTKPPTGTYSFPLLQLLQCRISRFPSGPTVVGRFFVGDLRSETKSPHQSSFLTRISDRGTP